MSVTGGNLAVLQPSGLVLRGACRGAYGGACSVAPSDGLGSIAAALPNPA